MEVFHIVFKKLGFPMVGKKQVDTAKINRCKLNSTHLLIAGVNSHSTGTLVAALLAQGDENSNRHLKFRRFKRVFQKHGDG